MLAYLLGMPDDLFCISHRSYPLVYRGAQVMESMAGCI